jgi:hypothetical protein
MSATPSLARPRYSDKQTPGFFEDYLVRLLQERDRCGLTDLIRQIDVLRRMTLARPTPPVSRKACASWTKRRSTPSLRHEQVLISIGADLWVAPSRMPS